MKLFPETLYLNCCDEVYLSYVINEILIVDEKKEISIIDYWFYNLTFRTNYLSN